MLHQIIEIQEENRYLSLERGFLKIAQNKNHIANVPLDDIAVLLISAQSVSFSKHILTELSQKGCISVLCGNNYIPQSIIMPVSGHYLQAGIMHIQIEASIPFQKNIWKQIIAEKLYNQAQVLHVCNQADTASLLFKLARTVKSGDSDNKEAFGARMYWKALFGDTFIRDRNADGINSLLNYGYAVMRASMIRAICSAGLLPALGIHHENKLNPFCLADDLFEVYRPLVDITVFSIAKNSRVELTSEIKQNLIQALWYKVHTTEGNSPVFQSMHYMVNSLVKALKTRTAVFAVPKWDGVCEKYTAFEQV